MDARATSGRWPGALLFALVALVLLGSLAYLLVLVLDGAELVDVEEVLGPPPAFVADRHAILPWLVAALAAAAAALGLWHRERVRAGASVTDDEIRGRVRRARELEREWQREISERLARMRESRGPVGSGEDVPSLVLGVAVQLLDAKRGLLFARSRGDGAPELLASKGFDQGGGQDELGEAFADRVLERDEIIRRRGAELERSARRAGVENLIAIPMYVRDEFNGAVVCLNSSSYEEHEEEVLLALGDQAGAVLENNQLHSRLRDSYIATVAMLAEAIKAKDPHLGGHSHEVSTYVDRVARRLELDPRRREELVFASLLHDLGKIGVSERILLKPGRLTPQEYGVVQLHPRIGARLVEQVPDLAPLAGSILHHHERFDGEGYPAGLRGEEIPLEARVIGVADAFSAMTSDRPYRGRMSLTESCEELERNAGSQFDPKVVRMFVEELRRDPPQPNGDGALLAALDDPEVAARQEGEETVLGLGPLEITDNLTLLYTHRYFHELVAAESERAAVQGRGFGVCFFELVELEDINRRDGYAAGDRAIQTLAHAVEQVAVRHGGTACRYGGRRIALLVTGTEEAGVREIADAVVEALGGEPLIACSSAAWTGGEGDDDVIARARAGLNLS